MNFSQTSFSKGKFFLLSLGLICLTALIFSKIWNAGFVFYDDINYVKENPFVQAGFTLNSLKWAWLSLDHTLWTPMTWISFMLDTEIYGTGARGYHLTNLALHIANGILIFFILYAWTRGLWKSFLVALFFLIHPLRVESVAWISERKDVLSLFFMLVALSTYGAYLKNKRNISYWYGVYFFFILGILSKMMLVTFPFLLLLLDFWPLNRYQNLSKEDMWVTVKKLIREKIGFFCIAFLFCLFNLFAYHTTGRLRAVPGTGFLDRGMGAIYSYGEYLYKMVWPFDLTVYQYYTPFAWFQILGIFAFLVALTTLVLLQKKRCPYLFVGWFWYLVGLIPVIGVIQFTMTRSGDRFTYIPSLGILMMIVWSLESYLKKWPDFKKGIIVFAGTFTLFFSLLTYQQVGVWQNSVTLFEQALKVNPQLAPVFNNAGLQVAEEGRYEDALDHFLAILKTTPKFPPALFNAAKIYEKMGLYREAGEIYSTILRKNPHAQRALEAVKNLKAHRHM